MMSDQTTIWTDLEKNKHPKSKPTKQHSISLLQEMLLLALVDRKFPEVRSGAAYLLEKLQVTDQKKSVQSLRNASARSRSSSTLSSDAFTWTVESIGCSRSTTILRSRIVEHSVLCFAGTPYH